MNQIFKRLRLRRTTVSKGFNSLLVVILLLNVLATPVQATPKRQETADTQVFLPLISSNTDPLMSSVPLTDTLESASPDNAEALLVQQASVAQGGWDDAASAWAFAPINQRGHDPVDRSPAGALVQAALWAGPRPDNAKQGADDKLGGNSNFLWRAPVAALAGRGLDLALDLTYNSLLWHQDSVDHNIRMTYNVDGEWPAPGWSLGFGRLVSVAAGDRWDAMLVDADGTRHPYLATVVSPQFTAHTTDGSLIDYSVNIDPHGGLAQGRARYPNGTVVEYTVPGPGLSTLYPTSITDANGNRITITYRNNSGPHLNTVVDTLGRTFSFHYDSNSLLTTVTGPGLGGGTPRPLIRLQYRQLTVQHNFPGMVVRAPATVWVIKAIYYPGTATGYWFGDDDSFSSYGMLRKVSERRAMTFSGAPLTEQGTINAGSMTRERLYSYPQDPGQPLTAAPTYATMTERWSDMDTTPAVTTYLVRMSDTPRRVEVTHPDGSKQVQLSYNIPCDDGRPRCPTAWRDGLVYQYERYDATGNLVQRSDVTWGRDAANPATYGAPRPLRVEVRDERGQMTATEYSYGAAYNQVTEVREFDYGGATVLRQVRTEYDPRIEYIFRHIFNLPTVVEVYEGNSATPASRTEYTYDGQPLTNTPGVVQHNRAYNPHDPGDWVPPVCRRVCEPGRPPICRNECEAGYWQPVFDPATNYRGNVTGVTTFADAATRTGAVSETRRYDITGNVVTRATGCCVQTSVTYTTTTQFAYPTAVTYGAADSASPARLTTRATYDFNTGLMLSSTDANGRTTQMNYHAASLRPSTVHLPTGAVISYYYDDAALAYTTMTSDPSGVTKAALITRRLNGLGLVRRSEQLVEGEAFDLVDLKYDVLGRLWEQTQPYRAGQPAQWHEFFYDAQGRVTPVRAADGSETHSFYNETTRPSAASNAPGTTVRTVDAWGRARWSLTDALGRLVEMVEPNPNGSGAVSEPDSLKTTYSYNAFDQLVQVGQAPQVRRFRYDSLGRLTHQYLPEKQATLNNAGLYGAPDPATKWSDVFTYDAYSNLTSHTDARGVKTNYGYANDPLNRLQSVTYDTAGFGDTNNPIVPAAPVSYQYRPSGDLTPLWRVTVAGISTAEYGYDADGRLTAQTLTLASRPTYPLVTNYTYDIFSRVSDIQYPAQHGMPGAPRKLVHHDYDVASRLKGLKVAGVDYASGLDYNAASQVASLQVGVSGPLQVTERAEYDPATGLLLRQQVLRQNTPLLDLGYDYLRPGASSGRTGQLTRLTNHLDSQENRTYTYDALGRLTRATGGATPPLWTQEYTYDRYGNRTNVTATGTAANGTAIPRDGLAQISYDPATNRITTANFTYDAAGNLTRALREDGVWQRYQYDAAGRLVKIKDDAGVTLEIHTYGAGRQRLITQNGESSNMRTYYAWSGNTVLAEYSESEASPTMPLWTKSYVYLGGRLLATLAAVGVGEAVQYHHTDRLSTRLVSNAADATTVEQATLPFGVALDAESTGSVNPRFTSYQRSAATGLDYAVNRFYHAQQGRFTQVDPLGMGAASLGDPQSLNLYAYVQGDPVNAVDPLGLKWVLTGGQTCKTEDTPDGELRTCEAEEVWVAEDPSDQDVEDDEGIPDGPGGDSRVSDPNQGQCIAGVDASTQNIMELNKIIEARNSAILDLSKSARKMPPSIITRSPIGVAINVPRALYPPLRALNQMSNARTEVEMERAWKNNQELTRVLNSIGLYWPEQQAPSNVQNGNPCK